MTAALGAILAVGWIQARPGPFTVQIAHFTAQFPFRLRFLLPWALSHLVSDAVLGSRAMAVAVTSLAVAGCFLLLPAFARRLSGGRVQDIAVPFAILLGLHYCWTIERLASYYFLQSAPWHIYDLPGIVFYLAAFLLLTETSRRARVTGYAFALLFSLSRETILLAPLHAAAFEWVRDRRRILPLLALTAVIGLVHVAVAHALGASGTDGMAYSMVGPNLRILQRSPLILLELGGGILLWLPILFPRLSTVERLLVLVSLPFAALLCCVGLLTELRIFNELVPLMAFLMARLAQEGAAERKRRHAGETA